MKKYFSVFTLFFLTISNLTAADVAVALDMTDYTSGGYYAELTGIETGGNPVAGLRLLFGAKEFNPKKDRDLVRASSAGLLTRKAFIKLNDAQFTAVVSSCLPFFSTSYGFSLIHGWMLNKFRENTTPYYIGKYFSFDKFFWGMINAMPATVPANAKNLIKKVWWSARNGIDTDRFGYYDNMLYLPYAIEQVGFAKDRAAPTMDAVIADARTTPDAFYKSSTAEFRAVMSAKAYMASGVLAATDNPQELFSDIMAWVLAHHINLSVPILPVDARAANFNVEKFVDYITDRAFTLYEGYATNPTDAVTLVQVKSADINMPGLQFGQALQAYLYALLRSIWTTINNRDQINDLIFATVKEAIGKAKRAQIVNPTLITLAPAEIAIFSAPNVPVRLTGLTLSPKKGATSMALQAGLQSDQTYLGELGVYFTPVTWVDGDLTGLTRFELADVLKTFESYLRAKERLVPGDIEATKGPYCGTKMGGRTYLAQIRAWRYKLLAVDGDTAVAAARAFIVSKPGRERIKASMDDRKPPAQ